MPALHYRRGARQWRAPISVVFRNCVKFFVPWIKLVSCMCSILQVINIVLSHFCILPDNFATLNGFDSYRVRQRSMEEMNLNDLQNVWQEFNRATHISPIRNEKHYTEMVR